MFEFGVPSLIWTEEFGLLMIPTVYFYQERKNADYRNDN
jgi:hypothetical protein